MRGGGGGTEGEVREGGKNSFKKIESAWFLQCFGSDLILCFKSLHMSVKRIWPTDKALFCLASSGQPTTFIWAYVARMVLTWY